MAELEKYREYVQRVLIEYAKSRISNHKKISKSLRQK